MRKILAVLGLMLAFCWPAIAGEAEIKAVQQVIDSQLRAFQADDDAAAYSYAAPNITTMFPTVETFMGMVKKGYPQVDNPQSYSFGKAVERRPGSIAQQVMITGPDGKEYEAIYTLQQQPDGTFKITGVSLRASKSLST